MSEYLQPDLQKHRRFLSARMILLQLMALCIVAVAMGLVGIHLFRTSVYNTTSSCSSIIADSIEKYGRATAQEQKCSTRDTLSDSYIQYILDKSDEETGMSLFLFDANGVCIACSEGAGIEAASVTVSAAILNAARKDGKYTSDVKGKFNPDEIRPVICHGIAFTITETDGTETEYFLFTNTYTQKIEQFTRAMLLTGCISVLLMLLVYAVFISRYTLKNLVRPDTELMRVTRSYAQGDFSEMLNPEDFSSPYYQEYVQSLNQIISNLKATGEQQSQFVSNVSHELRTPMTIISGYVDGMLDGTIPKEKRTEYLYIVSQEMQRLKILVSSMLNLTKFDNGTIQIKHELFTINDLIFRTILMFGNRLEKRNITVEGLDADTVRVYGDRDLIGQVIYNLTENAVKFVNTGGTITIRLEENKEESIFAIRNTGPGIPKDELPKIFDRFYKSDFSRSQDKTGLGLGLDIIRKILRLHNARISVSSEENVFTEFTVSFPKKPPAENAES